MEREFVELAFVLSAHILQNELFCHGQETVVPFGIEMSSVGSLAALEVDFAELLTRDEDVRTTGSIEDRDAIAAAHLEHGIDYLLTGASCKIVTAPRGKEKELGMRIFLDEPTAEHGETILECVDADGVDTAL